MKINLRFWNLLVIFALLVSGLSLPLSSVLANNTAQIVPFSQNWSTASMITVNDDWSIVPGIIGYLGDYAPTSSPTAVDPQTLLADYPTVAVDVLANLSLVTNTSGGVGEFDGIADPVVAMQGSGTADAPYLIITLDTTGFQTIQVAYNVRDIDTTADNSIQPVALHYRVGNTGDFTNIPDAYIADASSGPSTTLTTPINVTLPAAVDDHSLVQLRIMTTNAVGSDEWVGIDDISITGTLIGDPAPTVTSTTPANEATGVALNSDLSITFSEPVAAPDAAFTLSCVSSGTHTFARATTDDRTFTLNPDVDFSEGELCTATVVAAQVTDLDVVDPADAMAADYVFTFTTYMSDPAPAVVSTVPGSDATGVAVGDPLSVTFSEAVTLAEGALSLSCAYSGAHSAAVSSADNIIYSIDPDVAFTPSERCTVTLESTLITDSSAQQLAADYSWSFTTAYDTAAVTPIGVARTAGAGWIGTIEGVVTVPPGLLGATSFAIQDDTGGLYIYPRSFPLPAMALGDVVRVSGTIVVYGGLLEVDPVTAITRIGTGILPIPQVVAANAVAPTQGKLIQVEGTVSWTTTRPDPGASNFSMTITDVSGSVIAYVYRLTNIDLRDLDLNQRVRVTGVSMANSNLPQIQPRYQSDIVDLRAPTVLNTLPATDATGVSPHRPISATFTKAMDPDSLTTSSFTLTKVSDASAINGTVTYDDATHSAIFTPNAALEADTAYTATLTTAVTDSYAVPMAAPYSWGFTTGALDVTPPTITGRIPAPDATGVSINSAVTVTFSEELATGSLNLSHFILSGPGAVVVPAALSYDAATYAVTLTPDANLQYGTAYSVTVTADTTDYAGNPLPAADTWTFTTGTEPPMQAYFGDLHNHTSYSDGSGTPTQALAAGQAAGFDFMAISDHSYAISDSEWADTLSAAEAATDANFVALRGFEYTQGAEGHINVWNSTRHATRTNVAGCTFCDYTPNLEAGSTVQGFYPWLVSAANTPLDAAGEVMQFNHPGWINFNDWFFHPEVSAIARQEEVGNGSGSSYVFSEEEFIRSLDYGWKVGATNNADTHSTQWGTNTDARTGVLMPELSKTALLEALRERRTFATEDKNFSLSMKANGAWMGSEIANTGSIQFEISGTDADGELASLVELITDQGKTLTSTVPTTANFTWQPQVNISTGVHYFYVKVTQADGDRIVSSPVWTMGTEDIAITDITIQPTIPTIYSPSLLMVRVTNRVAESRTVTVSIEVNEVSLGAAKEVIVPANGDGYVYFDWQPTLVGTAHVNASLQGAPAGDNPDDNTAALDLAVTDETLPLILIDAGHGNMNASGNEMKAFIDDLSAHHYNVLKNLDGLTAADLNPAVVKLLIITAPEIAYTPEEQAAIADFVAAGGNLWMGGLADYTGSVAWAATVANRENDVLSTIQTVTGQPVNMRMNDDEVIDGNTNNGYVFGVIWQSFPSTATTGIGLNVESVSTWSLSSIVDGNGGALTAADEGVQIVMQGDLDEGYSANSYHNPFHTSQQDADSAGDAYIYNPTWVYPATMPAGAVPVPGAAVVQLNNGAGRIMLYGDSNDPFTTFAYTNGDGKQNELFNLQSIMWLLGEPLQKSTIAAARAQAVEDVPDNLNSLVWVEGEITAAYGEFFNVLYVQDETGGITVHAPAGDIDATTFTRGTHVRVIGTVDIYNGDTEIQFFEAEMVQVIDPTTYNATPLPLTTHATTLESNEGWLVTVKGFVTGKSGTDTLLVDDGSGPVRVFLDGYNGTFADITNGDFVTVVGLASEDGDGARIRVRNHNFHVGIDDDVIVSGGKIYMPLVYKN